ncbi:MAG: GIY-YIG nuclease family protein [bacterium]
MYTEYHVYVLQSITTGEIYIGQTSDLTRRITQHNDPLCKLTLHTKRRHGPWRLVYSEVCKDRSSAMKREKELKSGKGREWIRNQVLTCYQ